MTTVLFALCKFVSTLVSGINLSADERKKSLQYWSLSGGTLFPARPQKFRKSAEDGDAEKHSEAAADRRDQGVQVVDVVLFGGDDQIGAVRDVDHPAVELRLVWHGSIVTKSNFK